MFTMAKIKDGGTYLDTHLAANDYYCENESVVGQWMGRGAGRLGLGGEIHAGDPSFENLRKNRSPDGEKLTPRDSPSRVKFFDFQCSAQKSVSVMAVTLGDTRLLAAHDAAAKLAFGELERFAARRANTALTQATVRTANVVAATFRHTASRALDPQVHTHFVTANATWDEGKRCWLALTEFEMVAAIRYAGKVYQNEMARSCRALGYAISDSRDKRGTVTGFEITGVDSAVRERFSKRRADVERGIEQFVRDRGRAPTPGETHAITVASRDRKLAEITTPAVLTAQRRQLSPVELSALEGLRDQAIAHSVERGDQPGLGRERESFAFAASHLYERRSVATGHEIVAEALNQNLGHQELRGLLALAQSSPLIGLTGKDWLHEQFATKQGLALEQWAVEFVDRTKHQLGPLGRPNPELSAKLSPEQREAALAVLASRDRVVCLRGAAGVGKTTVLAEIRKDIEATGVAVFACAPTSSAAATMRQDGMAATTLTTFLENVALRERDRIKGAVLIVDESGLASNRQGAELLRLAESHGSRVLFLGDSRQHSSVEAGDFLRVLEAHSKLHRVELGAIRRQEHQAYREAIACLSTGAGRLGLERLDALGWVKEGRADYLRAAAADYVRVASDGKTKVLAVTPTWAEHEAFTREVRAKFLQVRAIGPGVQITIHEPMKWTRAQARNPANYELGIVATFTRAAKGFGAGEFAPVTRIAGGLVFVQTATGEHPLPLKRGSFGVFRPRPLEVGVGDRLLIRANHRGGRLLNGEIVTVRAISGCRLHLTDQRVIDSAKFREFTHGYAVTSHASQGMTVDHVIVAAARLDAKAAYVACSRARHTCTLHTPDKGDARVLLVDRPTAITPGRMPANRQSAKYGTHRPPSKLSKCSIIARAWATVNVWVIPRRRRMR
jgi:conjugative relaxase-like TrwC/TraI family protein